MTRRSGKKKKAAPRRRMTAGAKAALAAILLLLAPLVILNGAVSAAGRTLIFPLSPRHLKNKWSALRAYAGHLPKCLLEGHPSDLSDLIREAEVRHSLPTGLLAALIQVESGGRVHRISPTGAMGPGQLMPDTAKLMKVGDPFDPAEAIDGSARYLARQIARFHDISLALAAYNAGPGSIRGGRVPVNGETERYVVKVLREFERRKDLTPPPRVFRTFSDPGASSAAAAAASEDPSPKKVPVSAPAPRADPAAPAAPPQKTSGGKH